MKSFTELEVYKVCRSFRKLISDLVKNRFPENEKYKLSDQIIRSSRSITANIAEGFGRYYYKENIQFCRMARGSLNETLEHLIVAFDEKYIDDHELLKMKIEIDSCGKLLNGYINSLKRLQKPKDEDQ
jgi:four helix bundle protein